MFLCQIPIRQAVTWRVVLAWVVLTLQIVACAHTPQASVPSKNLPQTDPIALLYAQAVENLHSGLYPEAMKMFEDIETNNPYSRYAALAKLRIAEAYTLQDKYAEAIDAYENFLKFHPYHANAHEALFSIAEAYYAQIPADIWIVPPSSEKDQRTTRQALTAYEALLQRVSHGPLADIARQKVKLCQHKLAQHEMYVAQFYFKRSHFAAAAQRAEGVLANQLMTHAELTPQALWIAGMSRQQLGNDEASRAWFKQLLANYPQSKLAQQVRNQNLQ